MPWHPGVLVRLTDDQRWTFVCGDPAVTNQQLAATIGKPVGASSGNSSVAAKVMIVFFHVYGTTDASLQMRGMLVLNRSRRRGAERTWAANAGSPPASQEAPYQGEEPSMHQLTIRNWVIALGCGLALLIGTASTTLA